MAPHGSRFSRRGALKGVGAVGLGAVLSGASEPRSKASTDVVQTIEGRVNETPLVDTHEHLPDEHLRIRTNKPPFIRCDDWSLLFSHYIDSDLVAAGMPRATMNRIIDRTVDPADKWPLLEPYWPAVKHTGYGQAVRISIRELYGVDDLNAKSIAKVQKGYERCRAPGFYTRILKDMARIDSCQVNCLFRPFEETRMPDFLLQDISIIGAHMLHSTDELLKPTGIDVKDLADYHRAIDWWFTTYGRYAVAVKTQAAYSRGLDFAPVNAETAAPLFTRWRNGERLNRADRKKLRDHLFWYCAHKATEHKLPVKLHTGYYAGDNNMPIERVAGNPGEVAALARHARETRFVLMHIGYPFQNELIALAKHYTNIYIDMCWAWIIDPVSSVEFVKKFLLTAPANKLLPFGGDYIPVEVVLGHAVIARRGITRALSELVDEGWISMDEALELAGVIMRDNGYAVFNLKEKKAACRRAPWL